jgi:hypothetical protein
MPISCSGSPGGVGGGLSVEDGVGIALVCDCIWKCLSARLGDTSARETNLCHRLIRAGLCGGHAVSVYFKGGLT